MATPDMDVAAATVWLGALDHTPECRSTKRAGRLIGNLNISTLSGIRSLGDTAGGWWLGIGVVADAV